MVKLLLKSNARYFALFNRKKMPLFLRLREEVKNYQYGPSKIFLS
jgi:hypothetical protein